MSLEKEIQTNFGIKKKGCNNIIIVAPHAAGNDLYTERIARAVAQSLDAYFVVNNRHRRADCDLNDISDIRTNSKKKEFFKAIDRYAREARQHSARGYDRREHSLVIYIHGMKDREDLGIDIGIGAKFHRGLYKSAREHPQGGRNTGVIRTSTKLARQARIAMDKELKRNKNLRALMGKRFPAYNKYNAIQHHAGTPDHSMQIEINRTLRDQPEYTARVIAKGIQKAYKKL